MTHIEAIKTHIEADAPCTLKHVIVWASAQGFGGSKTVQAIQVLKNQRIIETSIDDDGTVIVDLI